jgi:hypothetical protein
MDDPLYKTHDTTSGDIVFGTRSGEMLRLRANGDILVKNKLIENDKEAVDAFKEWIKDMRMLKGNI